MSHRMFEPDAPSAGLQLESIREGCRIAATILGVVVMLIGCVFAVRLFGALYSGVTNPEESRRLVDEWSNVVGGPETVIRIENVDYSIAKTLAIVVLGGGSVLLIWLTLGMLLTGAKIVSWTTGDAEAVQRLLHHAFPARSVEDRPVK